MIENRKVEIVEEDEESSLESTKSFVKVGAIIIGSILFLMIVCIVFIILLNNKIIVVE